MNRAGDYGPPGVVNIVRRMTMLLECAVAVDESGGHDSEANAPAAVAAPEEASLH